LERNGGLVSPEYAEERRVDYDAEGNPRGIELLCVSTGVITEDLPKRAEVERILGDRGIKVYA
jgi:hypothetical protein